MRDYTQLYATLPIRLLVGGGILVAGFLKFFPDGYANIVHEFSQIGVPFVAVVGILVAIIETATGLGLVVGAYTRLCATVNLFNLLSVFAIGIFYGDIPAALPDLQYFPFQLPGYQLSLITIPALIYLLITGAGALSVDALRQSRRSSTLVPS